MELVVVLMAVGILGLAALVAVDRFGAMQAEPVRDTYQPPVPAGEMAADDLVDVRFGLAPMGYDMGQVDELMARMARELDERDAQRGVGVLTPVEEPGQEQPATQSAAVEQAWKHEADDDEENPDDVSAWSKT